MKIKLSIKMPPIDGRKLVASKVVKTIDRALSIGRVRVVPLLVDRVQQMADKDVPAIASRYVKAMNAPNAVVLDDKGLTVNITDPLVVAAEQGTKGYDLKAKLLAHAKHSGKNGPYVDVPFTHKAGDVPRNVRVAAALIANAPEPCARQESDAAGHGGQFG